MTVEPKRIAIGVIVAPHGVRGGVKLRSYSGDIEALADYSQFTTATGEIWHVKRCQLGPKGAMIQFEHMTDRTQAEAVVGEELYVAAEELPALIDDEYYYQDLINLAVVTLEGAPVGRVVAVHNYGAGDILEIAPVQAADKNLMIIFNQDNVPKIDLKLGQIVIYPEGLI